MGQNFYQRDVRDVRFVLNDQPDGDKVLAYDASNGRYFFFRRCGPDIATIF